jgi:hypothetical protein
MRKPTKLGYCATCNEEIFIFDVNGRPFRKRSNYREALVQLSDGSQGYVAFCPACLEKGVDAEECIQNLVDGLETDLKEKDWSPEFKEWYIGPYRSLKIMSVISIKKQPENKEFLEHISEEEMKKVAPLKKVYKGEFIQPQRTPPPAMRVPNVGTN